MKLRPDQQWSDEDPAQLEMWPKRRYERIIIAVSLIAGILVCVGFYLK